MSPSEPKHPHGHFVGNGGQAIEIDGRLFTRDLFERGIHESPHIGLVADAGRRDRLKVVLVPDLALGQES